MAVVAKLIRCLQKLEWPLRFKIGLAFSMVLLCFVINGVFSYFLLLNNQNTEEKQSEISVQLERLARYQLAYKSQLDLYKDTVFFERATLVRDTFGSVITEDLRKSSSRQTVSINEEFNRIFSSLYNKTLQHFSELASLAAQGQLDEARVKWAIYTPEFNQITTLLDDEVKKLESERNAGAVLLNNTITSSNVILLSLTAASFLLAVALLWLIEKVVFQPLSNLQKALELVALGDLDQHLEVGNRDEVGKLFNSFKQALSSLHQVLKGVQIGESLHQVISQLGSVSQQQASGSSLQVSALIQVTTAMQQLSQSAGQIASHSSCVAELIGITHQQIERVAEAGEYSQCRARQMVQVVEQTMNGVERVESQVGEIRQVMRELDRQAEAMGKVLKLLSALASEVHLLALNASIEASSAGMYGERFKEVAGQVKQLAKRANQATFEARSLIEGMQQSSRATLTQVDSSHLQIEKIVEDNSNMRYYLRELETSAGQVRLAVSELINLAGQVSNQAEEIKQATHEQYTSSTQVIAAAHSVEEVATQTSRASQEIARSSNLLDKLSRQLNGVLDQVKLDAIGSANS